MNNMFFPEGIENAIPSGFQLYDEHFPVGSWFELFTETCFALIEQSEQDFKDFIYETQIKKMKVFSFGKPLTVDFLKIKDTAFFTHKGITVGEIIKILERLLISFGCYEEDYIVSYNDNAFSTNLEVKTHSKADNILKYETDKDGNIIYFKFLSELNEQDRISHVFIGSQRINIRNLEGISSMEDLVYTLSNYLYLRDQDKFYEFIEDVNMEKQIFFTKSEANRDMVELLDVEIFIPKNIAFAYSKNIIANLLFYEDYNIKEFKFYLKKKERS